MNLDSISRLCRYKFGNTGWIAVDKDLQVAWFSDEPHRFAGTWWLPSEVLDCKAELVCTKYTGDKGWKDTLRQIQSC